MSTKRSPSDGEKRAAASLTSLIPDPVFDRARAAAPNADTHELLLSAAYLVILSQSQANTAGQMEMIGELTRIGQEQSLKADLLERENVQLKARLGEEKRGIGRPKKEKAKPEPAVMMPPSRGGPAILPSAGERSAILPPKKSTATGTGTDAMEEQPDVFYDGSLEPTDSDTDEEVNDKNEESDGSQTGISLIRFA